ncbi:MAG: VCBS repeat-containing protein [Clostridia bacterium]|nr:VCBS repeat-containing protein [Clostridia bacterium]
MTIKKLIAIALSALICLCLSGCDGLMLNVDELLLSPKLEGDMYPVQQALEDAVGDDITLKYPSVGEYRSAFVLKDINGDKTDEAFAFYSITADSTVTMHINVIEKQNGKWKSKGDLSLVGSGVESVSFADLDGNGTLEIIVGWYIFGTTEKQVAIYTYEGEFLTLRAIEPYTNFTYEDLTGDTIKDLAVIYLNSAEKVATAKLLSLSATGVQELGTAALDPGVSSYNTPICSKLADGTPALYIDAVKGSGMITEIVWYKDSVLHSIYNPEAPETSPTYRNGTVTSRDYNGNGVVDIPLSELLEATSNMAESDKVYYTNFSEFDSVQFSVTASALMNYSDGYSISVPSELKQSLLVIRKIESRARYFYAYNSETQTVGAEVFRIVAVSATEYDKATYSAASYTELGQNESLIYLAKITTDNDLALTEEAVKAMFSVLK